MENLEEDFVEETTENVGEGRIIRRYDRDRKFHSLHSPAIQTDIAGNFWFQNGKLHRLDGPAVENAGGGNAWYINGAPVGSDLFGFTREDFEKYKREHNIK